MDKAFRAEMADGYRLDEPAITLGSPMLGDEVLGRSDPACRDAAHPAGFAHGAAH